MSVARFGEPFTHTELADIDLGDEVHVGLFLCAHDSTAVVTASFDNVRIDALVCRWWTYPRINNILPTVK
jgi:hypothetical protein